MTTITLELPDDVARKARALPPETLAELFSRAVAASEAPALPPGFDPRLLGKIDPALYGSLVTVGDIVAPLDEPWEAEE